MLQAFGCGRSLQVSVFVRPRSRKSRDPSASSGQALGHPLFSPKEKRYSLSTVPLSIRIPTSRAEGVKTRTTSLRLPLIGGGAAGLAIDVGVYVNVGGNVSTVIGYIVRPLPVLPCSPSAGGRAELAGIDLQLDVVRRESGGDGSSLGLNARFHIGRQGRDSGAGGTLM